MKGFFCQGVVLPGKIFVVSGPSGVGKTTLIRKTLENLDSIYYSISATTRPPGKGEVEGKDYYFLSEEDFDRLIERDAFLEWEEVYGNRYGTLKSEIEKADKLGRDALLELDVKGALTIKSKIKEAVLIFIKPPSIDALEKRRSERMRGEENIDERRLLAPEEIKQGERFFDFIVVNDDIERAAGELQAILKWEKK